MLVDTCGPDGRDCSNQRVVVVLDCIFRELDLRYVTVALVTGLVIGFASLAVGLIVGKAMFFGSKGVGGRRHQIAAVLLTNVAVSMSAVLIAISQIRQQHAAQQAGAHTAGESEKKMDLGKAIGLLAFLGVASPFLDLQDPVHGLIGSVILFVGILIAWR
jgi:hypothetical protein